MVVCVFNGLIKNFSYTFAVNILSLVANSIIVFFVPHVSNIYVFSYFQLFLFYIGYIGYLQFGITDGLYLRLGGKYYSELDFGRLRSEFFFLICFSVIECATIIFYLFLFIQDYTKMTVLILAAFNIVLILPWLFVLNILQSTNRIREYSFSIICRLSTLLSLLILTLFINRHNVTILCIAFSVSQAVALVSGMYFCKDILLCDSKWDKKAKEIVCSDFKRGISLTLSNLCGVMIIGIVLWCIEKKWDVVTFGKVSLAFSMANSLLIFVRAIAQALFPILKRAKREDIMNNYITYRKLLISIIFMLTMLYYPISILIEIILPEYKLSIKFMGILVSIIIFESKKCILLETYFKVLDFERLLLRSNLVTLLVSFCLSWVIILRMGSLVGAVIVIVFVIGFQTFVMEKALNRFIGINLNIDIFIEILFAFLLIIFNWCIGGILGFFCNCIMSALLFYKNKKYINNIQKNFY